MADFVSLSCPTCGGRLEITGDIDRFACTYCGKEHHVNRGGGIVSLRPVVEGLQRMQLGVEKTAAELAVSRLERELLMVEARIVSKEVAKPKKQTVESWRSDYVNWAIRNNTPEPKAHKDFAKFYREYQKNKGTFERQWQDACDSEMRVWADEMRLPQEERARFRQQLRDNKRVLEA